MKFLKSCRGNKNFLFFCIISCCVALYFFYHTFTGRYGLISYLYQTQYLKNKKAVLNKIGKELDGKQNKVNKLRTDSIDLDLLDEKSREILGKSKTDEIVIYNDDIKQLKNKQLK